MSDAAVDRFSCGGCNKTYTWKPELAGKRVKCKCGSIIDIPRASAANEPDDMYDLAPSEEMEKPKRPVSAPKPVAAKSGSAAVATARTGGPVLPYLPGQTQREKDRFSKSNLMDVKRDLHVPIALLVIGVLLYLGYYAMRYHMSSAGIALTSVGLFFMLALKAGLLVGFALVLANPLGVSFGGPWTATLKLAAIAAFCDGVTTWVDAGVGKISGGIGGGGIVGWGAISFPIALAIYWLLLIYLFSMDSGDSWTVVMLLTIFDRVVKLALAFLILGIVLRMGGVSAPGLPSFGSSAKAPPGSELATRVDELQEAKLLKEARAYIADGHQMLLTDSTEAWYKAGAKNVWFEVGRDFNGKTSPMEVIVELPDDKIARAKCYQIKSDFYASQNITGDPKTMKDAGDTYMEVHIE